MSKFVKGQSGNPGGRPRADKTLTELAREHTPKAIGTLVAIMTAKRSPAAARVSAAIALLDRGYGKPAQQIGLEAQFLRPVDTSAEPMSMDEWDKRFGAMAAAAGSASEGGNA